MSTFLKYAKNVYCVIGVLLVLASVFGIYYTVDTTLAKATDLRRVEVKVDRFILSQEINSYRDRIFKIELLYGKDVRSMPPAWQEEYRCLHRDLDESLRKEKVLNK